MVHGGLSVIGLLLATLILGYKPWMGYLRNGNGQRSRMRWEENKMETGKMAELEGAGRDYCGQKKYTIGV